MKATPMATNLKTWDHMPMSLLESLAKQAEKVIPNFSVFQALGTKKGKLRGWAVQKKRKPT